MKQIKKWLSDSRLSNWGLVCLSLIVTLGLLELVGRFRVSPNLYQNDFQLTEEFRHFFFDEGQAILKPQFLGAVKTQRVSVEKPPGVYRVVLLGGSSVFNLKLDQLKKKLAREVPSHRFEVLNFGANAYGSNRLLLLLREVLAFGPDFIFIYSGHNEFEEQVLNRMLSRTGVLADLNFMLVRYSAGYRWVSGWVHWGMGRLGRELNRQVNQGNRPFFLPRTRVRWGGSLDKKRIHYNYRLNLEKIVQLARSEGIPIELGTVVFNREIPPFRGSRHRHRACFEISILNERRRCLEENLDLDGEPHRASLTTNHIVREVARMQQVPVVDFDKIAIERYQVPGNAQFVDHCHLNEGENTQLIEEELFRRISESASSLR